MLLRQQHVAGSTSSRRAPCSVKPAAVRPMSRRGVQPIVAMDSFKNFVDKIKSGGKGGGGGGGEDAARKAIQVRVESCAH